MDKQGDGLFAVQKTRDAIASYENAVVAVVPPDRNDGYTYVATLDIFEILRASIQNGHIELVSWTEFEKDFTKYVDRAIDRPICI